MTCVEARRRMLEADPAELVPGSGTDLGAHLAECASCRAAAAEIVRLERGLAEWLAAQRPRLPDEAALARAAATARRRSRRRRLAGAGLLAAAAAALLLFRPARRIEPSPSPARSASGFSVTAPPGRDLVVLQPADTNIVIVWYVTSRRSS